MSAQEQIIDILARDSTIDAQPILWARAMLEDAEHCKGRDARDAILARVGLVLFTRFAIVGDYDRMRGSPPISLQQPVDGHE